MDDKIPEALAVLDKRIAALSGGSDNSRRARNRGELIKARAAFAELIKAAATLNRESDYPIPAYFKKALAAVEKLP